MRVTRITVERLYNLGSYEHEKFSISAEINEGESAQDALLGLEKIIAALAPESKCCVKTNAELDRQQYRLDEFRAALHTKAPDEFRRVHGYFEGTPEEYVQRITDQHRADLLKRKQYVDRALKARELLDNLGGAAVWKDSKLDWENQDDF